MTVAIESKDLRKSFGRTVPVDGMDLMVTEGSIYGFLGQNGAGKTTTIRLILGLLRPTSGLVRLFGRSLVKDRLRALERVGSLVETPSLYDRLTGRENLEAARLLLGAPRSEIDRVLEIVDLVGAAGRLVGGYSLGMRQRLGVARALLGNPRLLLLDEPSNGLDPDGIRDMRALIRQLARGGVTILVSSHLLSEVEQVATHVGLMHRGRLLVQTELAELKARAQHTLDVAVADAPGAAARLASLGHQALATAPDRLQVELDSRAPTTRIAADVNATLVASGFHPFGLRVEEPTLEGLYLQAIGAEPPVLEQRAA